MDEITTLLSGLPWGTLTPSSLLGLVVVLVLSGKLVPEKALTREQENTELWKKAHNELATMIPAVEASARTSSEAAKTIEKILRDMPPIPHSETQDTDTEGGQA